ncbi:hypothetical protein ACIQVO_38160 [Streptomyces sp. NPDC101062]|uniref:hypothetical protein n=1 Tax=unclassified Streptomyces TaxID=2593676 RepID=UPI0037F92026
MHLQTFLDVCRVQRSAQQHYRAAFQRLQQARSRRTAPPPLPVRAAAGPDRGTDKISPWFKSLMNTMTAEDIETALTVGTAYLVAGEAQRNGTIMRTARDLFAEANSHRRAVRAPTASSSNPPVRPSPCRASPSASSGTALSPPARAANCCSPRQPRTS